METPKSTICKTCPEYTSRYFERVANYGLKGIVIGSLLSKLFFGKFKAGVAMGLGIALGYCHQDLINAYSSYFTTIREKREEPIIVEIKDINDVKPTETPKH
jgi:hypothetical protein